MITRAALALLCACLLAPLSSLHAEAFEATLDRLTAGKDTISLAKQKELGAAGIDDLAGDICGVRLGMGMQQVIDRWGMPKGIWTMGEGRTQLSIYASTFTFRRNQLVELAIHCADLPDLVLFKGALAFNQPLPDLAKVFPGATISKSTVGKDMEVELKDGTRIQLSVYEDNLIAIAIAR